MNYRNIKLFPVCATICAAIITGTGCRVAKPDPLPAVKQLPATFADSTASQQGSQLIFRELFPDPYLNALIDSALKNNTDLKISLQRIITAQARLTNSRQALLPSVDIGVRAAADKYGDYTLNGVGNFDTNLSPNINEDQKIPRYPTTDMLATLQSSWEIDLWGKLGHLRKAAAAELQAYKEAQQMIITHLIATIAKDYYNLLRLDAELLIIKKNIALQEEAVEIVKVQKLGGRATELAVQQFRAQLLNTKAMEFAVLQERLQTEASLNTLAAQYFQEIPRDTALPASAPVMHQFLPATLLSRRPDIREAEALLKSANENVEAARASFLPSLTLNPYVGLNAFTPSLLFKTGSIAYGIAGGITAPLFNRRHLKLQYAAANAANQEAVYNYQQKLLNAYNEVSIHIKATHNYQQAFDLKQQEVDELHAAASTARELYLTGYANYLEVITAQKNTLEAELQLTREQSNMLMAVIQLYRSLGGDQQK